RPGACEKRSRRRPPPIARTFAQWPPRGGAPRTALGGDRRGNGRPGRPGGPAAARRSGPARSGAGIRADGRTPPIRDARFLERLLVRILLERRPAVEREHPQSDEAAKWHERQQHPPAAISRAPDD